MNKAIVRTTCVYVNFFSSYQWRWKLKKYCEAMNKAIVRTTCVSQQKKLLVFGKVALFDFCWT